MAAVSPEDLPRIVESAIVECSLPLPEAPAGGDAENSPLLSMSFEEIGFDSLNYMEFCVSIAVNTGIELTIAEVTAMNSPAAVVKHLSQRV
jgi:acyl carrier protein